MNPPTHTHTHTHYSTGDGGLLISHSVLCHECSSVVRVVEEEIGREEVVGGMCVGVG